MAASLLPDYITFLRVLGWAAATLVCWLAAGVPRMPPRRAGLALGMFGAAQMSFGMGGFFHYDVLSFGDSTGGWLALAKLASFGFVREFARGLGGGRMGSRLTHVPLLVVSGLVGVGMLFPGRFDWGVRLGEFGLVILPPLICADAMRQFAWWAGGRGERGWPRWAGMAGAAVYMGVCVLLALWTETPLLVGVLQPLVPWLLAGSVAWASLRAVGADGRLAVGFAWVLAGVALAVPLAMRVVGPAEARPILLAGGLAVVFGEAGFLFAWWQALAMAQQLAAARREAASRAKTEFLAFLGHELRTPLQAILGRAELLRGDDDPAARGAAVATIAAEGRVMLNLVNDLLDLGAIEAGRFELRPQVFSLRTLLGAIAGTHGAAARATGLEFELTVAPDVPDGIVGDEARWRQVLGNLLGNAVKYTVAGRVELGVTREPAGAGDAVDAARVRLVVRDTGIGLPPEKIAQLFTLFTRFDGGVAVAREGAGVGLALVKRLVDLMGGTVTALNRSDGLGAEFTVELVVPTLAVEVRGAEAIVAVRPSEGSGLRVLVVEDHPATREVLMDFLRSLGHAPTAAADGVTMWVALAGGEFDAVVLDVNLPGADGVQLGAELAKRRGWNTGPRIVGCSADGQPEMRAAALAAGMDAFLVKPVSRAELGAALEGKPAVGSDLFSLMRTDDVAAAARRRARAELPGECATIRRAVEARNWDDVRRRAHYLRNSAWVLGEAEWVAAAETIERAAARGDAAAMKLGMRRLDDFIPAPAR